MSGPEQTVSPTPSSSPSMGERIIRRVLKGTVILLGLFIFFAMMIPGGHPPEAGSRSQCKNNLKQIGLALHNYHDAHGCFPPAYVADEKGRPIHSWRVLILPFFDRREHSTEIQQQIHEKYRFDEPWDGPNNRLLQDRVLDIYTCRSETAKLKSKHSTNTNYVAVIGPETMWAATKPVRTRDVTDALSNTLMVVETRNSGIHWMEPRDLHVLQMAPTINGPAGQGISSAHHELAYGLFADASARAFSEKLSAKTLRALLTIKGNEPLDNEDF